MSEFSLVVVLQETRESDDRHGEDTKFIAVW